MNSDLYEYLAVQPLNAKQHNHTFALSLSYVLQYKSLDRMHEDYCGGSERESWRRVASRSSGCIGRCSSGYALR